MSFWNTGNWFGMKLMIPFIIGALMYFNNIKWYFSIIPLLIWAILYIIAVNKIIIGDNNGSS